MANSKITTRSGKGAALSAADNDQNLRSLSQVVELQTAATYTVTIADQNKLIELDNSSMVVTLPSIASILASANTPSFTVMFRNRNSLPAKIQSSDLIQGRSYIYLNYRQSIKFTTASDGSWMSTGGDKPLGFSINTESATTGKNMILVSSHSLDRNIFLPDATGTVALNATSGTGAIFNRMNPQTSFDLSTIQYMLLTGVVEALDVVFIGISSNVNDNIYLRIGSSNVLQTSSYVGGSLSEVGDTAELTGINLDTSGGAPLATDNFGGFISFRRIASNAWSWKGAVWNSNAAQAHRSITVAGTVQLSGSLNIVGFASSGTFDVGSVVQVFAMTSG